MTQVWRASFDTPLGPMIALANQESLLSLQFADTLEVTPHQNGPLDSIQQELKHYFAKQLTTFQTPLLLIGTPFQKRVWEQLRTIPYRQTISYQELAIAIQQPTACRAVAQANGANPFVILVPCHRVIQKNGQLGGYSCGIERKRWLLQHEQ